MQLAARRRPRKFTVTLPVMLPGHRLAVEDRAGDPGAVPSGPDVIRHVMARAPGEEAVRILRVDGRLDQAMILLDTKDQE